MEGGREGPGERGERERETGSFLDCQSGTVGSILGGWDGDTDMEQVPPQAMP